ncbi:DUF3040 domain-containing protein [Actinobacteria bacterium YIM 96077]|uniref:DUF3040 domain-containing protein n=1 Tax=Phytoactinopolyspora halophila TaxID=1981511 RepID=A0A329QW81_9ACTN|nr:DUF3040 domain-containing protein [Phytoactinopolyspora halophila]AYY12834.1 DUF3040 domain-containing protein [Actinobacteria bacterium YIM 96077]RAW16373.1 hypothetical protein DPM12_06990 [Phytoactinopolyspora halophila]
MPLSDHEQRLLEQMEQALQAEDPKFATTMRGSDLRRRCIRRAVWAGIAFVIGIVMLMTGAITEIIPLGVAGFVVMLGSAWLGVTSWRRAPEVSEDGGEIPDIGPGSPRRQRRSGRQRDGASFMQRMEERWRQRRERGYGN